MFSLVGQEDPLEEETATHSSILAWRIPRTEEPDGLQFMDCKESVTTEQLSTHTGCDIGVHFDTIITIKLINVSVTPSSISL